MRKALSLGVLSVCLAAAASAASAAEIHGTLSEGGKPVAKGTNLKLVCGDVIANAATDEFGAYSLKTATTPSGDCKLSVTYKGSTPSLSVVVYDRPSRYDLEVREESGKLTLARK
jgi:opacity protein-like surface antigen